MSTRWRIILLILNNVTWLIVAAMLVTDNQRQDAQIYAMVNNSSANFLMQQQLSNCQSRELGCMNDLAQCRAKRQ